MTDDDLRRRSRRRRLHGPLALYYSLEFCVGRVVRCDREEHTICHKCLRSYRNQPFHKELGRGRHPFPDAHARLRAGGRKGLALPCHEMTSESRARVAATNSNDRACLISRRYRSGSMTLNSSAY